MKRNFIRRGLKSNKYKIQLKIAPTLCPNLLCDLFIALRIFSDTAKFSALEVKTVNMQKMKHNWLKSVHTHVLLYWEWLYKQYQTTFARFE